MMENFFKRVAKAQTEIKAPKNQRNSFGNYNYRSCEDILEAAKPVCAANGLLLTVSDEIVLVGERYYIKATATLHDAESDSKIENTAYARESLDKRGMDDSQITGTASSYARKYALNGLFCIDDTKDADTNEYTKQTKQTIEEVKAKFDAPKLTCDNCQKVILGYTGRGGKQISPEEHIQITQKMFGKTLCKECAKAEQAAKKE